MDDQELAAALGQMPDEEPAAPEAASATAADDDATDLIEALAEMTGDPTLAGESAPDAAEDEADPLASAAESDEPELAEDDVPSLKARLAELEQAKRDADAARAETEARAYWWQREQVVEQRFQQALEWLYAEKDKRGYDGADFVLTELPRIAQAYAEEKAAFVREQATAWERLARQHGAQTYRQTVQTQFALSDAEMTRIATHFAPEQWQGAAQLLAEAKAPIKQELTTTKGKLTKAERAVHAQRLKASRVEPGTGRATVSDIRDLRDKVTGADGELGAILRVVGAV